MITPDRIDPDRRQILKNGALFAAALPYVGLGRPLRPGGSELLRVGLIGCGGRGTGAARNALLADDNVKLVAMGDAFRDHLDSSLETLGNQGDLAGKVDVAEDHKFTGFDAYRGVIEASDVVLLATSPHFRPLHVEAAVEAGKHLFVEKPVATDGPGLRRIKAACEKAREKNLNVVSGLCYRYQFAKQETMRRIHDGAIGEITALECTYNTGGLWYREPREDWSQMEVQMRNWLYFNWLSGDHINEQHIHSLDKIAWAMGDYPVRCTSSGGRVVRTDPKYGNVYDHFNTVYQWANGVKGFSSCRQWHGAASNVSDFAYGTQGTAALQAHRIENEEGRWRWRSDEPDDMYQNEHDVLFRAIRAGEVVDDSDHMIRSTLMAIMARMAAYTGQEITADQAMNSQEDLSPAAYAWTDLAVRPVARPGITKFS